MPKLMPIMHGELLKGIPWALIEPHEKQAADNHYQTLARLAERGGLSPDEALAVLENRQWRSLDQGASEFRLITLIAAMQ